MSSAQRLGQLVSILSRKKLEVLALGSMCLVYFFSYFQRVGVPGTIFNDIQSDLQVSASAVTTLSAIFVYIYAGAQLFVGAAADRFGGVRTLLFGGALMTAGSVLFPLSRSLELLYVTRAITALGASLIYLSIVKEMGQLFSSRHFPALLGYTFFCGYCGGVAGTIPLERAAHFWGWRHALTGVGIATAAALTLAFGVFRRLRHEAHPVERQSLLRPLLQILRNRLCWPVLVTALINFAVFFVIQTTLGKKFLEDVAGVGSATAALFTTVMMACSAVGVFLAGPLLKLTRERRRPHLVVATIMIIVAVFLMLAGVWRAAPSWIFLLAYVLLALSVASGPAAIALMKEYNTPETLGLSVGVYNCAAYIGVAVLANVGGLALDAYADRSRPTPTGRIYPPAAYVSVFVILGALALVSLVAAFLTEETRGQPITALSARQSR